VLFKLNDRLKAMHVWKSAPGIKAASRGDVAGAACPASPIVAKTIAPAKINKVSRGCITSVLEMRSPVTMGPWSHKKKCPLPRRKATAGRLFDVQLVAEALEPGLSLSNGPSACCLVRH